MKKPSSLAEQIQQAQKTVDSWTPFRKSTMHLEGYDVFMARTSTGEQKHKTTQTGANKQKVHA